MTYEAYVLEVFKDDQNCQGVGMDEIDDIIEETPFPRIERFLARRYDLITMFETECI